MPEASNSTIMLYTWPDWPKRKPEEPIGWNQWQYTEAPLSLAHSSMAAATASALFAVHADDSSSLADSPCFFRYLAATSPEKRA